MSIKSWLRKVLNVEPQIIERTTFIYPQSNTENAVAQVLYANDTWFHFSNASMYSQSNYESDLFKCASALLGPTKAATTVKAIKEKWGTFEFYINKIPEGKVVVDYINSDKNVLEAFHNFNHTDKKNQYDIDEQSFKAYEHLSNKLLDLKMVNYDLAEDIEAMLKFVGNFVKKNIEEKKSK